MTTKSMRRIALAISVSFATLLTSSNVRFAYSQTPAAPAQNTKGASQTSEESLIELNDDEKAKFSSALDQFNRQDFAGALAALNDIYQSNPAARPPRVVLANWFAQLQNARATRLSLEMATDETPNDPEAYYALAEIAVREGELTAAELLTARGDQALAQYTGNQLRIKSMTRTSYSLKLAYSNARQRWSDAQNAVLGLIKTDGETAELDRAYARTLFQQNQDTKALQAFQRAEKLDPEGSLPADAAMAQLYAARGDYSSAKASLNAALEKNPKSPQVLTLSVIQALNENNLDEAYQLARRLYAEDKSAEVLKTYGKVALFRADYKGAEAAFQEATRINPLDTDASSGLALALCEQEDAEKKQRAVQYAASNLQKRANNRDFLATLGWTLYKSGQVDEALKALQQSIADGQINAASAYYLAVILNERGQKDSAKQLLTAALGTQPPFAKRAAAEKLLAELNGGDTAPQAQPAAPAAPTTKGQTPRNTKQGGSTATRPAAKSASVQTGKGTRR